MRTLNIGGENQRQRKLCRKAIHSFVVSNWSRGLVLRSMNPWWRAEFERNLYRWCEAHVLTTCARDWTYQILRCSQVEPVPRIDTMIWQSGLRYRIRNALILCSDSLEFLLEHLIYKKVKSKWSSIQLIQLPAHSTSSSFNIQKMIASSDWNVNLCTHRVVALSFQRLSKFEGERMSLSMSSAFFKAYTCKTGHYVQRQR